MSEPAWPELVERVRAWRRDFHAHPELGFGEHRTAAKVADHLRGLGLEPREGVGQTGVSALLEGGGGPGRTVLLRADMDALPILEETGLPFASQTPGLMHACGHDAHTAILMGAAEALAARRDSLPGRVLLVFQPHEEGTRGARAMLDDGLLDGVTVDAALGLHVWADEPVGTICLAEGPVMAAAKEVNIQLSGRGGHAASPSETVDPVVMAAHLICALQTVVSRNVAPRQAAVVTIGSVQAGSAQNIIPNTAALRGTIRAFEPAVVDLLMQRVTALATGLAESFGGGAEVSFEEGVPPVINDPALTGLVREAVTQVLGAESVVPRQSTMGGEDFAWFGRVAPACFWFVGARNESDGCDQPHHHPRFKIDERCLEIGLRTLVAATERAVASG